MCGKNYDGFFKLALTFAAKTMQHTANQLHQWAREPDFGVKSFTTRSIFLTSRSVCLPYQGVVFLCCVLLWKLHQWAMVHLSTASQRST
jgi:hypothetical protein